MKVVPVATVVLALVMNDEQHEAGFMILDPRNSHRIGKKYIPLSRLGIVEGYDSVVAEMARLHFSTLTLIILVTTAAVAAWTLDIIQVEVQGENVKFTNILSKQHLRE